MSRPPRGLTEADRAAWASYASRLVPLPGQITTAPAKPSGPPAVPPLRQQSPPREQPVRTVAGPLAIGDPPGGVDRATWQRFRSGKLEATRKLDLHGHTAHRAFHALMVFLRSAHAERLRCVEVVTGRGSGEEIGVLRREFPLWLNRPDIRPMVLAAAHPHAANPGAVRLLLRRVR